MNVMPTILLIILVTLLWGKHMLKVKLRPSIITILQERRNKVNTLLHNKKEIALISLLYYNYSSSK